MPKESPCEYVDRSDECRERKEVDDATLFGFLAIASLLAFFVCVWIAAS